MISGARSICRIASLPGWRFARHTNDHRDALDQFLGTAVIADPAEAVAVVEQADEIWARRSGHRAFNSALWRFAQA